MIDKEMVTEEEFDSLNIEILEWFYLLGKVDGASYMLGATFSIDGRNKKIDSLFNKRLAEFKNDNVKQESR